MPESAQRAIDDCWNQIGVRGDRSCARLEQHIHCRECPVYANTAKTLLARVDSGTQLPSNDKEQQSAARALPLLVFRLGMEWLAMPTSVLAAVATPRPVHSLPRRSGVVLGLCNVRGRLAPCVSLAALLDLAQSPAPAGDEKTMPRMLVFAGTGGAIVTPVDHVDGIQLVAEEKVGTLPATVAGSRYACGVIRHRDRSVGILDAQRILDAIEKRLT